MTTTPQPSAGALKLAEAVQRHAYDGMFDVKSAANEIDAHVAPLMEALENLHAAVWAQAQTTKHESIAVGAARRAAHAALAKWRMP